MAEVSSCTSHASPSEVGCAKPPRLPLRLDNDGNSHTDLLEVLLVWQTNSRFLAFNTSQQNKQGTHPAFKRDALLIEPLLNEIAQKLPMLPKNKRLFRPVAHFMFKTRCFLSKHKWCVEPGTTQRCSLQLLPPTTMRARKLKRIRKAMRIPLRIYMVGLGAIIL